MRPGQMIVILVVCFVFTACVEPSAERARSSSTLEDSTSYTITKTLGVTPEKVYNAYLDPQALKQIWNVDSISVDAKPEGQTSGRLRINDQNLDFTLTYKEVIPNQKLKWVMKFVKHPKIEIVTTVVFNSIKEGTELSFSQENFNTKSARDQNRNANTDAINKLSSLLVKL